MITDTYCVAVFGADCVVYHDHSAIDKDTAYAGLEAENLTVS